MTDDTSLRGAQDRIRVAGGEDWEVDYVVKKLGVSREDVRAAIRKVGNSRDAVEAELKRPTGGSGRRSD